MSVGLYVLPVGAEDRQTPHMADEVYVVLQGRGRLRVVDEEVEVKPGIVISVDHGEDHKFIEVSEDLQMLVVFAPPDLPDETYALMVVDVARPLAHRVFPGEVGFGFQCWTPDDRAIRAIGPDGSRSVLVIPVDGGPVVQLPAPATSTTDVCPLQRLR